MVESGAKTHTIDHASNLFSHFFNTQHISERGRLGPFPLFPPAVVLEPLLCSLQRQTNEQCKIYIFKTSFRVHIKLQTFPANWISPQPANNTTTKLTPKLRSLKGKPHTERIRLNNSSKAI